MTSTDSLIVGGVCTLFSILFLLQLRKVWKLDRGIKRRILIIIIAVAEIGLTVWTYLQDDDDWILPLYLGTRAIVLCAMLYIFDRSKKVYNDLKNSGRVEQGARYWWISLILLIAATALGAVVLFESSFFDDDLYIYLTMGSFVLMFFSWCFFAHFLNFIRLRSSNAVVARMFWLLLFTTIYTLLLIAGWYAYVYEIFDDDYDDWSDLIDSLDVSDEVLFISFTVFVFISYKMCVISMMGSIPCDVCGCTSVDADKDSGGNETRFIA